VGGEPITAQDDDGLPPPDRGAAERYARMSDAEIEWELWKMVLDDVLRAEWN
jgi:hypothetical protein